MQVQISSILRSFKSKIEFLQPVYEAIANSFEANAKTITIVFHKRKDSTVPKNYVDSIDIIDDGEGFTDENIASFENYMSDHKLSIGGKGVGRFAWLKIFDQVNIRSETTTHIVTINFSKAYDEKTSKIIEVVPSQNCKTRITFSKIINQHDQTYEINIQEIKKSIIDYFALTFIQFKNKKRDFSIIINSGNESETISAEDIHDSQCIHFEIKAPEANQTFKFTIDYLFIENAPQNNNENEFFLCGNGRLVEKYKAKDLPAKLPNSTTVKALIHSQYLDERINNERTSFTFNKHENNPSFTDPLPFVIIASEVEKQLGEIILGRFPSINKQNEAVIEECVIEKPYLSKYISADTSIIKDKKAVLKYAQNEFEKDKENTRSTFENILKQKHIDSGLLLSEFDKLNELSNRELAQYFIFRQIIIDSLKRLDENDERLEKYLHSLFFDIGGKSNPDDPISERYKNCVWLLDDKYMAYNKLYSDQKISKIKKEIKSGNADFYSKVEPDITIFYSNNDVVVIEFKGIGAPIDEKLKSFSEINRNMGIIAKNFDNLNNIYGYVITKFDNKFNEFIKMQPSIQTFFSTDENPIYYSYNSNLKDKNGKSISGHLYFISAQTIYTDANSRNRLFIDILKNKAPNII